MRRFHHGGLLVRPDAGIRTPKDLEGKKVGVRAYSVTTGVWLRHVLIEEFGLDSSKVTWVVDDEEHVTGLKLPSNVIHAAPDNSLADMMAKGELAMNSAGVDKAAVVHSSTPYGFDNSYVVDSCATYPGRLAAVGSVDVLQPDAPARLRAWVEQGLSGLRLFTGGSTTRALPATRPSWAAR